VSFPSRKTNHEAGVKKSQCRVGGNVVVWCGEKKGRGVYPESLKKNVVKIPKKKMGGVEAMGLVRIGNFFFGSFFFVGGWWCVGMLVGLKRRG
jgi:hypothetical protein